MLWFPVFGPQIGIDFSYMFWSTGVLQLLVTFDSLLGLLWIDRASLVAQTVKNPPTV